MTLDGISAPAQATAASVKVAENQEDQKEKVVGKVLESVEASAPSRSGFNTGQSLNIAA